MTDNNVRSLAMLLVWCNYALLLTVVELSATTSTHVVAMLSCSLMESYNFTVLNYYRQPRNV